MSRSCPTPFTAQPLSAPPTQKGLGYWFLLAFLAVAWVSTVSQAVPHFIPSSLGRLVNLGVLALYPVLLVATVWLLEAHKHWLSHSSVDYMVFLVVVLSMLISYGLIRGNSPRVVMFDILSYVPVVAGLLLGRLDRVWQWIMPPVMLLTTVAIVAAVSFTDAQVLTDRTILNDQVGSYFEGALTLAPLLAIVAASERRNRWYFPLLLVSLGVLFIYLYFGRRGISVRAGMDVLCAAVIVPMIVGSTQRVYRSIALIGGGVVVLLLYFPFYTLLERYLGRYGLVDTLTIGNERWFESVLLWRELSWSELIVGRGFGGAFLVDQNDVFSVDEISGGRFGKIGTHLGLALPVLKGGFVFALIYFLPSLKLAGGLRTMRNLDPITLSCAVAVPFWLASQLNEGALSYSTPWVGFGIGLLFSRAERVGLQRRPQPVLQGRPPGRP